MEMQCPQCGQNYDVSDWQGQQVECQACQSVFDVPHSKPVSTEEKTSFDRSEYKKNILAAKKEWNSLDNALQTLRDGLKISGRISQSDKAEMLTICKETRQKIETSNIHQIIKSKFKQYLDNGYHYKGNSSLPPPSQPEPVQSGCASVASIIIVGISLSVYFLI